MKELYTVSIAFNGQLDVSSEMMSHSIIYTKFLATGNHFNGIVWIYSRSKSFSLLSTELLSVLLKGHSYSYSELFCFCIAKDHFVVISRTPVMVTSLAGLFLEWPNLWTIDHPGFFPISFRADWSTQRLCKNRQVLPIWAFCEWPCTFLTSLVTCRHFSCIINYLTM